MDPGRLLASGTGRSVSGAHSLSMQYPYIFQKATRPVGTSPNKDRLHQTTPAVTGTHRSDYYLLPTGQIKSRHNLIVAPPPAGPVGCCPLYLLHLLNLSFTIRAPNGGCILQGHTKVLYATSFKVRKPSSFSKPLSLSCFRRDIRDMLTQSMFSVIVIPRYFAD